LTDRTREPREEGIEREVGDEHAVDELDDTGEHDEDEERVNELEAVRRLIEIGCPEGRDGG